MEPSGSIIVGNKVTVNQGDVVRPSQLIASVRQTIGGMMRGARVLAISAVAVACGCQTHQRLVRQDEGVILNDLRKVISAEAVYESLNGGFPDRLECLGAPRNCIPGYPKDAPAVLDAALARLVPENGYTRQFHPGPPARLVPPTSSPSSLASWAYTAVPSHDRRGRKAFCADSTQRICATLDGSSPVVHDGTCGMPCERVQ